MVSSSSQGSDALNPDHNNYASIIGFDIASFSVCAILCGLRFYVRIKERKLKWDDWFLLAGVVSSDMSICKRCDDTESDDRYAAARRACSTSRPGSSSRGKASSTARSCQAMYVPTFMLSRLSPTDESFSTRISASSST